MPDHDGVGQAVAEGLSEGLRRIGIAASPQIDREPARHAGHAARRFGGRDCAELSGRGPDIAGTESD